VSGIDTAEVTVTTSVDVLEVHPVRGARRRPWARAVDAIAAHKRAAAYSLLAGSIAIWIIALQPWHWYMGDLVIYRAGSSAFLHHHQLYSLRAGRHHLPFTYPPIASVLLSPFAVVPLTVAKALLSLLSVIGLVVCLRLVFQRLGAEGRTFGPAALPVALAAAIWLEPVRATIDFGQINLLLMVAILVDVLGLRDQRRSGFLIGLAAAVKLTPLAFIPYLFLVRRRRAAANAVASFVGCTFVGLLCYPGPSVTYWGHLLFLHAQRIGRPENASNQSVRGIVARGLGTAHVPVWWVVVAGAVFVAGTAVAVMLYRRRSVVWSVTAMSITMLCVSPISWSHHWAWCAVMLPVCWDLAARRRGWRQTVVAGIVMVPFAAGLTFWAPHFNHEELSDSLFQQFLSSSYVLAGVLLVALLAVAAISGGARPSRTPSS